MRRVWLGALGVAFVLGATSCAKPPPPPDWIQGSPPGYAEARYTWGVGAGYDAERAAAKARAEVARKTQGETQGVEIVETWIDEERKVHWALAVLDRTALVERLTAELSALEAQLRQVLALADQSSPDQALDVVIQLIELTPRRDGLVTRITHLSDAEPPTDPDLTRARLDARLAEIKRDLPIEVEAFEMDSKTGQTGDPLDEIRRALAQKVLDHGFPLGTRDDWGEPRAWLRAFARIGFERLELLPADRFVAVHWDAALEIEDLAHDGRVVAILTEESRATHLNEREARRQAQEDAEAFVAGAFEEWLAERVRPRP